MGIINILDEFTANQIAAGEVVERPVSVVKELVENSLDAGATNIIIELTNGGLSGIRVVDNGCGMSPEDALICFQRHATSKISQATDLNSIFTLGFRGEALPSIASVARVTLITRHRQQLEGIEIVMEAGELKKSSPVGCPPGTSIEVQELFYNTPARRKYLKSQTAEAGQVSDLLTRLALARPNVKFELRSNGKMVFQSPGNGSIKDTAASIFGYENVKSMLAIEYRGEFISVQGLISKPLLTRASRQYQSFFVNGRYIKSGLIASVLQQVYQNQIPSGRFPIAVLHIELDPTQVDVNVHPTKMEVRLAREKEITEELTQALSEPLSLPLAITGLWEVLPTRNSIEKTVQSSSATPSFGKPKILFQEEQNLISKEESVSLDSGVAETTRGYQAGENFPCLLPVGQFLPTYVLAQGQGGLYIFDQHAAHERILYEKYQKQLSEVESQMLLEPISLDLPHHEAQLLIQNILSFSELGFILEHFGGDTFLLRGVPAVAITKPTEVFIDLLTRLQEHPVHKLESNIILDRLAAALACRDAVKAGQHMGFDEIKALLKGLADCQKPYTCPHGRPTLVNISHEEMNKRFKR